MLSVKGVWGKTKILPVKDLLCQLSPLRCYPCLSLCHPLLHLETNGSQQHLSPPSPCSASSNLMSAMHVSELTQRKESMDFMQLLFTALLQFMT